MEVTVEPWPRAGTMLSTNAETARKMPPNRRRLEEVVGVHSAAPDGRTGGGDSAPGV